MLILSQRCCLSIENRPFCEKIILFGQFRRKDGKFHENDFIVADIYFVDFLMINS